MTKPYWLHEDNDTYTLSYGRRSGRLPAGMWLPATDQRGTLHFFRAEARDDEILRFPDSPVDNVLKDIESFWERSEAFDRHGIPHKRGILLHGPPGSGKTFTIQLIARDVIARDGVVFIWNKNFAAAYRQLRAVEPTRPLVVLMEDLDTILEKVDQSVLLNILDGAEAMHHLVFVASTNYLERLEPRVKDRPSRFDRKVELPHPSAAGRRMYLESLLREGDDIDMDRWVRDTDGMSMAHIKELFVGVLLLGNPYGPWLRQLKAMQDRITSADYNGFLGGQYK